MNIFQRGLSHPRSELIMKPLVAGLSDVADAG